jgi:hypothetical protein
MKSRAELKIDTMKEYDENRINSLIEQYQKQIKAV